MNINHKYRYNFGGWLKQNAGTIGSVVGTVGGAFIGMPELGAAVGGMAGGMVQQADANKTAEAELVKQNQYSANNAQLQEMQQGTGIKQLPYNTLVQNNIKQNKNGGEMAKKNESNFDPYTNRARGVQSLEGTRMGNGRDSERIQDLDNNPTQFNTIEKGYDPITTDDYRKFAKTYDSNKIPKTGLTVADEFKKLTGNSWSKSASTYRNDYFNATGQKLRATGDNKEDNLKLIAWLKSKNQPKQDYSEYAPNAPQVNPEEDIDYANRDNSTVSMPQMQSTQGLAGNQDINPVGYEVGNRTYRNSGEDNTDVRLNSGRFVPSESFRGGIRNMFASNPGGSNATQEELQSQGKPVYQAQGGLMGALRNYKIKQLMAMGGTMEDYNDMNKMSDNELNEFHKYCHGGKMR